MKKMRLSKEDMLNLRVLELEQQVREKNIQFLVLQKELFLKSIDPESKLAAFNNQIKSEMDAKSSFLEQYNQAIKAIGDKFKIDMSKFGYDDETGALISHED